MAKSIRSKVKRRMRTARRQHFYEVEGKHRLEAISAKLTDPLYDSRADLEMPKNAFLNPSDPSAVFPQHSKPHIIDMRSHKIAGSGFTSKGNFRKSMSDRTTKAKFATVAITAAELAEEVKNNDVAIDDLE